MSNVASPFPPLGEVKPRIPSPISTASPFAMLSPIVDNPRKAATQIFPNVEAVQYRPPVEEPAVPAVDLELIRAEAAQQGYIDGYEEGVERGVREGKERGFEQGRREAFEQESAQTQRMVDAFVSALQIKMDMVNREIPAWMQSREEAMAELAIGVVRNLLSHELATSRESAVSIAREAMAEVTHANHARIRVNPFDVPVLEQNKSRLIAASTSLHDVDFVEDPSLLGGCVVETSGGYIDASVDTRLATLEGYWKAAA